MNWEMKEMKDLVRAFILLRNEEEVRLFLRDLMTEGEIVDFSKRLQTASLLSAGASYPVIQKETGFSTTTIARVSKWLQTGGGGYKTILARLHHHTKHSQVREVCVDV
jgi:TrpR-related protein YerC/YecD